MTARQKRKPQWNAEESGEYEPTRAAQVDVLPVLNDNDARDRNRHQHRQRRGDFQRNAEREQWNRDQSLAKAKCRSNQRGDKYDE
jgi:hypothetical protein